MKNSEHIQKFSFSQTSSERRDDNSSSVIDSVNVPNIFWKCDSNVCSHTSGRFEIFWKQLFWPRRHTERDCSTPAAILSSPCLHGPDQTSAGQRSYQLIINSRCKRSHRIKSVSVSWPLEGVRVSRLWALRSFDLRNTLIKRQSCELIITGSNWSSLNKSIKKWINVSTAVFLPFELDEPVPVVMSPHQLLKRS